jgi:hypothetical protein
VLFATCRAVPTCSDDDRLVLDELEGRGLTARPAVWDDPSVRWEEAGLVVIRSTWDYFERPNEFLAWVNRIADRVALWNPAPIVHWNAHKRYLLELERQGIAVVPTELVPQRTRVAFHDLLQRRGWSDVMIKPAIGGNAYRARRVRPDDAAGGEDHFRSLLADGDAMVQPFQRRTADRGERSIVFIDGEFAHAVEYPSTLVENPRRPIDFSPTPVELDAARRTIHAGGVDPFYARLDYLPADDDGWRLGELELIEPELFFRGHRDSVRRFADGCQSRLPRSG